MAKNETINYVKFFAAFLVVCIHVHFGGSFGILFMPVARTAVPIFFIISGLVYYKKAEVSDSRLYLKRQIKKYIPIAFIALAIYFIFYLFVSPDRIARFFEFRSFAIWALFNEPSLGGHLWYLFAYLYVLIIVYILNRLNYIKLIIPWAFTGILIYTILGKYSLLIFGREFSILLIRNFLFMGLPYFGLGYFLAGSDQLNQLPKWKCSFLVIISFFCLYIEYFLLNFFKIETGDNNYIFNAFLAVSIIIYALNVKSIPSFISRNGSTLTLLIYIIHPMIAETVGFAIKYTDRNWTESLYWKIAPVVVFIISIIFASIYIKIKNKLRTGQTI